jgi:hypothetical protein
MNVLIGRKQHSSLLVVVAIVVAFVLLLFLTVLSPSQRRGAPFRGEGTNSARLFTPGERNALAKSKVHQISRTLIMDVWVVISLISKYGCSPGVKKGKI